MSNDFEEGMAELALAGNYPYLRELYVKGERQTKFKFIQTKNELLELEFHQNRIFIVGGSGSGKSWTLGEMMRQAQVIGHDWIQIIVDDIEKNFKDHPVLNAPLDLWQPANGHDKGKILYIKPSCVSTELIAKFMGFPKDDLRRAAIEAAIDDMKFRSVKISINAIVAEAITCEGLTKNNIASIMLAGNRLAKKNIFDEDKGITYDDLVGKNRIQVIDFHLVPDHKQWQATVGALADMILTARRMSGNQEFKPLFFGIDEAQAFVPNGRATACNEPIDYLLSMGRKYEIQTVPATQYPKNLEPSFIGNMDVLIVHNLSVDNGLETLKKASGAKVNSDDLRKVPGLERGECLFITRDSARFGRVVVVSEADKK